MASKGRQRRFGTAARLVLVLVALMSVVFAVTGYATVTTFSAKAHANATNDLEATVRDFTANYLRAPSGGKVVPTSRYLQRRVLPQGSYLIVRFPAGNQLGTAGSAALQASPSVDAIVLHPPLRRSFGRVVVGGQDYQYVVGRLPDGGAVAAFQDLQAVQDASRTLALLVSGQALVALLASVVAGYLLLRRLLVQVGDMTETARAVADGATEARIGDPGTGDEMAELAVTLDSMLDRLSAALDAQRRLLSDVSHQLRTPLTVARGQLEVLERTGGVADEAEVRSTITTVVAELDHMRRLTERLLVLGRSLEADFLDLGAVEVLDLCEDVFGAAQVLAPRSWSYQAPDSHLLVEADYGKLRGIVLNLVENAVKHTSEGDAIELTASATVDGSCVEIAVGDSGPGVPVAERGRLTERFARAGGADTEGSGLGLAIVTAVAAAHGGSLQLGESRLGGLRAVITLPLVDLGGGRRGPGPGGRS